MPRANTGLFIPLFGILFDVISVCTYCVVRITMQVT